MVLSVVIFLDFENNGFDFCGIVISEIFLKDFMYKGFDFYEFVLSLENVFKGWEDINKRIDSDWIV